MAYTKRLWKYSPAIQVLTPFLIFPLFSPTPDGIHLIHCGANKIESDLKQNVWTSGSMYWRYYVQVNVQVNRRAFTFKTQWGTAKNIGNTRFTSSCGMFLHCSLIKHFMTGSKGNSEFCFCETLIDIDIEKMFCYISRLKNKKKLLDLTD